MSTLLAEPLAPWSRRLSLAGPAPWQALTAALIAAALVIGVLAPVPDVSWLLMVGERMLHGERLYTRVIEANPPMSVLIYLPAVGVADALAIPPEAVVAGLCVFGILLGLALTGAILRPLIERDGARAWKLAAAGAFVLGVMPAAAFGEREHIAVMALLPFVAICVVRAEGRAPPWPLACLAGLGLGMAIDIKPHFAAVALLPALWAAWRSRTFRPLGQPELWAAAAMVGGYGLAVLLWFPAYLTDLLPVLREVYLPIRTPFWLLLILPAIPLALGAAAVARLMRLDRRWLEAPLLAALGGAVAFLVQGKGWPYHAYPMLAFVSLGLFGAAALAPQERARAWTLVERLMLVAPSLAATAWLSFAPTSGHLARDVAAVAPPAPRLLAVSGDFSLGVSMVRRLHARWTRSVASDWISEGALRREDAGGLTGAERLRLDGLISGEHRRLARDLQARRPDVILLDRRGFDWRTWALGDPAMAAALRAYRLARTAGGVEIWIRSRAPSGV